MRAKAKNNMGYSVWIEGEYITKPPVRPMDGAERPEGHYIDTGGYPGANVYSVDMATFCLGTAVKDKDGKEIYDNDFLIWESKEEIAYYLIQDRQAVDIVTGEVFRLEELEGQDIRIIGNLIDSGEFIDGINHAAEKGKIPYVPLMSVQLSPHPYFTLQCEECGYKTLSTAFQAYCRKCGGWYRTGYATKIQRRTDRKKVLR